MEVASYICSYHKWLFAFKFLYPLLFQLSIEARSDFVSDQYRNAFNIMELSKFLGSRSISNFILSKSLVQFFAGLTNINLITVFTSDAINYSFCFQIGLPIITISLFLVFFLL